MTGAMYAAISGLKAHMNKLNVIGNNIANVNTPGYKSQSAKFTEALYTTLTGGSNGTDVVGGINPAQLGYGCSIGTIDLDMSTKNYIPDGDSRHCMIDGDGFFLVGNKPNATTTGTGDAATTTLDVTDPKDLMLTRVGDFKFDSQGYLVDGQGNVVYGFVPYAGAPDADGNLPVSTQLVPIRLPQAAPKPTDAGDPAEGTAIFPTAEGGTAGTTQAPSETGWKNVYGSNDAIQVDSIKIDGKTGKIVATNKADSKQLVVGYIALANVSNPAGVSHIQGPYYQASEGAGDCVAASIGEAVTGNLNNQTDAGGGTKIPGTGNAYLIPGGLESSGTDLATEISEMITTQRGYQANTRIITVTDSMLEELVNMKR